jgi:TolB-like protein
VDQLVDREVLGDLWYRLALVVFVAGFPVAMIISWYHGAKGAQRVRALEVWLLAAVGVLTLGSVTWVVRTYEPGDPASVARRLRSSALDELTETEDPRRIAVLYFQPRSTEEEVPFLAAGLTEALIDELGAIDALHVVSRNGVAAYRGEVVPADSIGRILRVGTLVDGTVALSEGQIRVNVAFLNANTGEQFGRTLVQRPRTELFQLQDDLAHEVAVFLRGLLGEELELIERQAGAENVEAWEVLQRARAATDHADALSDAGDMETAWDQIGVADSLLAAAEELAPEWVDPTVERGWLAYQRSRWAGVMEQRGVLPWIEAGLEHAEVALQLQPDNADALELRGTLHYWQWILDLAPGPEAANELFDNAETDLRQAAALNEGQAGAWAALSHLLLNKAETAEAKLAASRAYQADAYLRNADVILWRLFSTSYDLQDQTDAIHWCAELGRRFPGDDRFAECRLWLMTMHDADADVDSAWAYADYYMRLRSPQTEEFDRRWVGMAVAAVLVKAGQADSARAVAQRSRGDATIDPIKDLAYAEAYVQTLLGDYETAIDLLTEYMAVSGQDPSEIDFWWFTPLEEIPRYRTLRGW